MGFPYLNKEMGMGISYHSQTVEHSSHTFCEESFLFRCVIPLTTSPSFCGGVCPYLIIGWK